MITAAATASTAPIPKAAGEPYASHTIPNAMLAGNAAKPTVDWYQPKAVPRRRAGTRSATNAFSVPSVRPKTTP